MKINDNIFELISEMEYIMALRKKRTRNSKNIKWILVLIVTFILSVVHIQPNINFNLA